MTPSAFPTGRLSEDERKNLAMHALAGSATICDLVAQHGVSRKFVGSVNLLGRKGGSGKIELQWAR